MWSDGVDFDVWSIEKPDFKPRCLVRVREIACSARGRGVRARSVHDDLPGARGRCLCWCGKQTRFVGLRSLVQCACPRGAIVRCLPEHGLSSFFSSHETFLLGGKGGGSGQTCLLACRLLFTVGRDFGSEPPRSLSRTARLVPRGCRCASQMADRWPPQIFASTGREMQRRHARQLF